MAHLSRPQITWGIWQPDGKHGWTPMRNWTQPPWPTEVIFKTGDTVQRRFTSALTRTMTPRTMRLTKWVFITVYTLKAGTYLPALTTGSIRHCHCIVTCHQFDIFRIGSWPNINVLSLMCKWAVAHSRWVSSTEQVLKRLNNIMVI